MLIFSLAVVDPKQEGRENFKAKLISNKKFLASTCLAIWQPTQWRPYFLKKTYVYFKLSVNHSFYP